MDGIIYIVMPLMENTYETFDKILVDPFKNPDQKGSFYTMVNPVFSK